MELDNVDLLCFMILHDYDDIDYDNTFQKVEGLLPHYIFESFSIPSAASNNKLIKN